MKKLSFMALFVTLTSFNAHATNDPFVVWDSPFKLDAAKPDHLNLAIAYLKNAARGIEPSKGHSTLVADATDYKKVWGEAKYNRIIAASADRFAFGKSKGGEQNNGINDDKNAAKGSLLDPGVDCIWFKDDNGEWVNIAKLGDNNCLNPLGDWSSPALQPKPKQADPQTLATTGNNNQQVVVIPAPKTEMSAWEYLGASGVARTQQKEDIRFGADLMKEGVTLGASLKNCCGTTQTTTTSSMFVPVQNTLVSAQPMMTSYAVSQPPTVIYQNSGNAGTAVAAGLGGLVGGYLGAKLGTPNTSYVPYPIPIGGGTSYVGIGTNNSSLAGSSYTPPQVYYPNNPPVYNTSQPSPIIVGGNNGNLSGNGYVVYGSNGQVL